MNKESIYNPIFVKELFNRVSDSYDKVNGLLTLGLSSFIRNHIIKSQLDEAADTTEVLDLMSGNGEGWKQIVRQFPNCHITAIDISEEMTKHSMTMNSTYFGNKVTIVNDDILENSFESNYYDVIICAFGLKHFDNSQIEIVSKEVFRLLKTGGCFLFFDISKPGNRGTLALFTLFFKFLLPFFSKFYTGNYNSYKLLWQYLDEFTDCERANRAFALNGLQSSFRRHFSGMVSSISGYK